MYLARLAALGCIAVVGSISHAAEHPPCVDPVACQSRFPVDGGKHVPFYRTHPLRNGSKAVTRAVIVVHGNGRSALGYFRYVVGAARDAGIQESTLILAPHFQAKAVKGQKCKRPDTPAGSDVYWTCSDWKHGGGAVNLPELTSFDVLDRLVGALLEPDRFPNLAHIVVTGHSAGGQVTQRYAAGNAVDGRGKSAITFSYVVANPSSYMYLDEQRPSGDYLLALRESKNPSHWDEPAFSEPADNDDCPEYNAYRYGLQARSGYMKRVGRDTLRKQFVARRVTYLVGTKDHRQDKVLDKSCQAKLQGPHRLARGHAFWSYMNVRWKASTHTLGTARCKHDGRCMYASPAARKALFRR